MKRKFKITEEQYNNLLESDSQFNANADTIQQTTESKVYTKKEILESRKKYLKNNSKLYTYNNFLKKIKK